MKTTNRIVDKPVKSIMAATAGFAVFPCDKLIPWFSGNTLRTLLFIQYCFIITGMCQAKGGNSFRRYRVVEAVKQTAAIRLSVSVNPHAPEERIASLTIKTSAFYPIKIRNNQKIRAVTKQEPAVTACSVGCVFVCSFSRLCQTRQHRHLPSLQRGLGGVAQAGEIRHDGVRFLRRVVLRHGDKVDVSDVHEPADVLRRRAERIVCGDGQQHGTRVAQVRLDRQRDGGVSDAVGQFAERVARAGRDNQQIEQLFRADRLDVGQCMPYRLSADGFDFASKVRGRAEPCVG